MLIGRGRYGVRLRAEAVLLQEDVGARLSEGEKKP